MFFFTPRFLKQAKLLHKGVTRFIDYKRDLLPQDKLDEILTLRRSLEDAMKARDRQRIKTLNEELNKVCEQALPNGGTSEIGDNVEVFFVAIVIALGIRGYIAQPFQIPTGSMQPTLNGITAEATAEDPTPGLLGNLASFVTSTRYINVVSDHDGELDPREPISEHRLAIFMPYCLLHFKDGHTIKINCPQRQLLDELQLVKHINSMPIDTGSDTPDRRMTYGIRGGEKIRKGQLLARGIVRNGDHVLVDKFSFHFRTPKRGEVFVFTTKHIPGITVPVEQGAQHYIKRLAGLPHDMLQVKIPEGEELWPEKRELWRLDSYPEQRLFCELWHNGKKAKEPGFARVMNNKNEGYHGYTLLRGREISLSLNDVLKEEQYFAMGDNSANSSDSRYWGTIPERNLVGPALFCYWPLTSHWGRIK